MGEARLNTPRVRVVRESADDLEIQTTSADMVRWDRTRFLHKWPPVTEAPILWMTFVSWAAARRTGAIPPDYAYEQWEADVLECEVLNPPDGDETGHPFPPVPMPD